MAQKYGGKYSPSSRAETPSAPRPRGRNMRVDPAGARANVMFIPKSSTIKLTDFGIARITDSSKTKTGMVLGTPSYMSPEQLVGQHIDGRSDIFSLGIMLFQLLSGQLPFKGDSMAALMFNIANNEHPDITGIRPELKKLPDITAIIDKMLDKKPEQRYQTCGEVAKDLRLCLKKMGANK